MRRTWIRPVALTLALALAGPFTAGCYGKFQLTRKIFEWNGSLGNKFVISLVFFVLFFWFYPLTALVDYALLNVIEFWTGNNPMTMKDGETKERLVINEDGTQVRMVIADRGTSMRLEVTEVGKATKVMQLRQTADGMEALDGQGTLLGSGGVDETGALVVRDARGETITSKTGGQVEALSAALARGPGSLLVAIEAQRSLEGSRVAMSAARR